MTNYAQGKELRSKHTVIVVISPSCVCPVQMGRIILRMDSMSRGGGVLYSRRRQQFCTLVDLVGVA